MTTKSEKQTRLPRIRTIKPEIGLHEGLFDLEQETGLPIRFAWAVLPCHCDREGRFAWQPRRLGAQILPYDEIDFSRVGHAWVTRGLVVLYRVGHAWFGVLPTFKKHQVINNREGPSELPGIDEADEIIDANNVEKQWPDAWVTRGSRVGHAWVTESHIRKGEGKGRERKGTEKKKSLSSLPKNNANLTEREETSSTETTEKTVTKDVSDDAETSRARNFRAQQVAEIFAHWKVVFSHPRARLGKRGEIISKALGWGYSSDDLKQAIDGCSKTPHNIGQNERGQIYDGIHIIFKSADSIDRFMSNAINQSANNGLQKEQQRPRRVLA